MLFVSDPYERSSARRSKGKNFAGSGTKLSLCLYPPRRAINANISSIDFLCYLRYLLVAGLFHPVHGLAVERLLNDDVCHGARWRSADRIGWRVASSPPRRSKEFSAVRHGGAVIDIGFIELIVHTCLCDAVVEHLSQFPARRDHCASHAVLLARSCLA
jgi:hypothetical protein